MERTVLITGSNLGDRERNLAEARRMLAAEAGAIVAESGIYESEPWGEMGDCGGDFLNQVLVLETGLGPMELLDRTQEIERRSGRKGKGKGRTGRRELYESRTIDIDILYYGEHTVRSERLTVPHPLMAEREFVLGPLAEVLPDIKHPETGKTAKEMLDELKK